MITTRTRALSILATVAMMVSMLACFVIPASAAAADMYTAIYNDAESGAEALKEALDSSADEATLAAAATGITFKSTAKPRYAWKAAYAAAGYTGTDYAISEVADWVAMGVDAKAASGDYFSGLTFHLTKDIDFANAGIILPLGNGTNSFLGTLDGHGYGFSNIHIICTGSADYKPLSSDSVGLFYYLGTGAEIKDFGLNSGEVVAHCFGGGGCATSFGCAKGAAKLTRVWSGAAVRSTSSGHAVALVGNSENKGVIINGAYFYGILGTNSKVSFTVAGAAYQDAAKGNTYKNIISDANVRQSPNGGQVNGKYPHTDNIATSHDFAMFRNVNLATTVENVYGITGTGKVQYSNAVMSGSYTSTKFNQDPGNGSSATAEVGNLLKSDVMDAVIAINNNPSATDPVYYSFNAAGEIRPVADATNKIVKVTVSGDVNKVGYFNVGTIDLAADLGLYVGEGATYTLGAETLGATVDVAGDVEIIAAISQTGLVGAARAELAPLVEKYAAYDPAVMADGTLAAFKAAVAAANEAAGAENEVELVNAAIAAGKAVNIAVSTTYPNFPQYKDYAIYKDCNAGNNWLIASVDDWKAMMAAATAAAGDTYFAGYTFHLVEDVDFATAGTIAPMAAGKYFGGTINGHGYGFSNITLVAPDLIPANNTDEYVPDSYPGLFYRMGNCVLQDFGINSGSFKIAYGGAGTAITAFGYFKGKQPQLLRTWFGADLTHGGGGTGYISVLGHECADSNAIINGFYFYGAHIVKDAAYSNITGSNSRGNKLFNIIAAPKTVKATDRITIAYRTDLLADNAGMDGTIGNYKTTVYDNVYGVGYTQAYSYRTTTGVTVPAASVIASDNAKLIASSAQEAAWKINSAPTANATPVYYSFNANGDIRPVATADNAIVKITVTGDVVATEYANKGSEIALADLGINMAPTTTVVIDGVPYEGTSITLTGDVEIDVDYDAKTLMDAAMAPFINMDAKHLSNGDDLTDLKEAYADALAANDEAAMADVIDVATAFVPAVWGADNYAKLPEFSKYETYKAYNAGNNWLIATAADWLKMVAESKEDTAITYQGYNFHLNADVDFNNVAMAPLCYGGVFRGNIDGHGYGFDNVLIDETTITLTTTSVGLICKMTNGTIQNFGINSGAIDASKVDDNAYNYVGGLVGVVSCSVATDAINITRCWNGADVDTFGHSKQASGAALAGCITSNENGTKNIIINGFLNTGDVTNRSTYGGELYTAVISSGAACHKLGGVFNSLNTGTITGLAVSDATSVNPGMGATFMRLNLGQSCHAKNNASTGSLLFFHYGDPADLASVFTYSNGYASAEAAAYAVNKGNAGLTNAYSSAIDPVYYTITAKGIRPTGTADNAIVKVTLTGTKAGELYVNKNSTATVAAIAAALGVDAADILTINGAAAADVAITGDTTLEVAIYVCDHTANTNAPVWDGANGHKTVCSECDAVIASGDCDGSWIAGGVDMGTGVSAHTMICTVCNQPYEEDCNGTLVADTADCTKDSKYVFTCGVHNAEYVIEGSGNANHTYEGEWIKDGDLEYRKCVNCEVKETREACKHTVTKVEWVEGTETHKIVCANAECGALIDTVACGGTWAAGEVDLTNGTSKHTKTCPDCRHDYEVACNGTLVADTTDCTNDSKYVFECGVHNAEYVIVGSGHEDHDFSESEWDPAEGAAGTKQSMTCACCTAKIYQIIGGAAAEGVDLKADAAGNIVLTLPIALKSAKLTFTVPAGYTVTNVEGAAADAGFYTVANTAAGATVTITVDSALSAIGGVLEVAVTDAIAEDDTAVTDAIAQATIGFTAKEGDANGDDAISLIDALDALYVVAGTKDASTINAYNANVYLAESEDKNALVITVNDVYEIIGIWLRDVVLA